MIKEIFYNISDEELLIAVLDIKITAETTGLISAAAKEYGQKIREYYSFASKYDFETARTLLLEQAAFRWADRQKEYKPIIIGHQHEA